jgi:hypothetical protein
VLQGNRAFIEHSIPQFDGLVSVEHSRDVASLRRDLERVPFAAGFRLLLRGYWVLLSPCLRKRSRCMDRTLAMLYGQSGIPTTIPGTLPRINER